MKNKHIIKAPILFMAFICTAALIASCGGNSNKIPTYDRLQLLGSFEMNVDPLNKKVEITNRTAERMKELGIAARFGSDQSIYLDNTVKMANCKDPDWNSVTNIMSVNAKLVNRTDQLPDTHPKYKTIYLTPLEMRLTYLDRPNLVTAVNTDLSGASCGNPDLILSRDDKDGNGYFDCLINDQSDSTLTPGWSLSDKVGDDRLIPGEESDCSLIIQFTLKDDCEETGGCNFRFWYDILGVERSDATPDTPGIDPVTTPTNVDIQTISGTTSGDCETGGTVYIDGGLDPETGEAVTLSTPCKTGVYKIEVGLHKNTTNKLEIYQVVSGSTSGSKTVEIVHDDIKPKVTGSSPAEKEENVSRYTNIVVNFDEAMKESTFINRQTIFVDPVSCSSSSPVDGAITLSSNGMQMIFEPDDPLEDGCEYKVQVYGADKSDHVTDLAGNPIEQTYDIVFVTSPNTKDETPPEVVAIFPTDNARDISRSAIMTVTFSEPMDPDSFTATDCNTKDALQNIDLVNEYNWSSDGKVPHRMVWNSDATRVDIIPTTTLEPDTYYSFIISSCVKDRAGNPLSRAGKVLNTAYDGEQSYHYYNMFRTSTDPDTTPPSLVQVIPHNGATNTPTSITPWFIFSETIDPSTIVDENVYMTVLGQSDHIPLSLSSGYSGQTIRFRPLSSLATATNYTMTSTVNVTDLSGNGLNAPQTSKFETASSSDTTPPKVISVSPEDGSSDANPYTEIVIWFSEPVDPMTVNHSSVIFDRGSKALMTTLKLSYDDRKLTIVPGNYPLRTGTTYNIRINRSGGNPLKDRAGNAMPSWSASFRVQRDRTAPKLIASWPPDGSADVPINSIYVAFFDEPIDPNYVKVKDPAGLESSTQVRFQKNGNDDWGLPFVLSNRKIVVLNVFDDYAKNTKYRVIWKRRGVRDRSRNKLAAKQTINFKSGSSQDNTAPTVLGTKPEDNDTNVSVNTTVAIEFSEAMDPRTITEDSLFLYDDAGNLVPVEIDISTDLRIIYLEPVTELKSDTIYHLIATTALRDAGGGNRLGSLLDVCFSTGSQSCK